MVAEAPLVEQPAVLTARATLEHQFQKVGS